MYRLFLPLMLVAFAIPLAAARTLDLPPGGDSARVTFAYPTKAIEPSGPITLHAALLLASQANPDVAAARQELSAVEASALQAGVLPNPSVGVQIQDTKPNTRETVLQLSQPIELGGKRAARVRVAERSRDAAVAELRAKEADVQSTVISAFFDLLTAQERVRLAQQSVELAQQATTVISKRVGAGKVSPVEETRARVAESGVRLELVQARSELTSARRRLSATWGNSMPRFERAEGELQALPELPDPNALLHRLSKSPELARAQLEVDRRQALAQVERSRRIPDVTVTLGVDRNRELGRNQAIISVSVPIPVFDTNRGNVLEALCRADKARDELAGTETRLEGELSQAFERQKCSGRWQQWSLAAFCRRPH
jgi:cobalt-zinc-cadmium efflux system outer membrane protein